jgi:1-acyl-sn-glycerol-3-phosphate acyltransferase
VSRGDPGPRTRQASARGRRRRPRLPIPLAGLRLDLDERIARVATRLNDYGFDPFGAAPAYARNVALVAAILYRYWFRVETHGISRVPEGRVLLIGNHAGNTFAYDATMLAMAMLLEAEPPRLVRGMGEYYLLRIPFFGTLMQRSGSVVGTPENCLQLLGNDEAVMVFPEGAEGFVKPFRKRYQLQRFGLGFMRLAIASATPIVPVGIVGAEEQSPAVADVKWLGRLVGSPAFPITPTFPWLGLAGFLPLPVKFRIRFGEPLRFEGEAHEDDAAIERRIAVVKKAIGKLLAEGRAEREGWFS